ncbi:hypothetical protein ACWCPF_21750 [Streptomyces sp. NPDC001858]
MTGHESRAGAGRASHAGACTRAGLFAVLGTVLATFGHHAVADGAVPWRLVAALIVVQFAAVWPLARRRYAPVATIAFTLATQQALHLALSYADGAASMPIPTIPTISTISTTMAMPQHAMHAGHLAAASGDGHSWHHSGAAMTAVHTLAALAVAWLLHRADAGMTAALGTLHTLARAAVAALAQALPWAIADPERALLGLPAGQPGAVFAVAARAWDEVLEYAVVRRGPPRRERPPVLHRSRPPRRARGRIPPYRQGVPLWHPQCHPLCPSYPRPPARRRVPGVVSWWPAPSR